MIEFRILGPLEVEHEGRLVPLGGTRQRTVLAILLLHRGEVVSMDRLVDELWGERPPDTDRDGAGLRVPAPEGARPDLVLTRGGGYVLELEPAQLDAERFERLAGDGRDALERGEAASASSYFARRSTSGAARRSRSSRTSRFAQSHIARLEELRLVTLEQRIEADLALGRHAALIPSSRHWCASIRRASGCAPS